MEKWIKCFLKESDLGLIENAITEAEKNTSGEVVPMIVKSSSVIGHVPIIFSLLLIFIFDSAVQILDTEHQLSVGFILVVNLILLILGFALSRFSFIQRIMTTKSDLSHQVWERAEIEFHRHNLKATENRTAILIMLSLMEREIVVLADESIAKKLPTETWNEVVSLVLAGIKKGRTAEGLQIAILKSGQILSQHFPIQANDKNEIKNHLIIKE